MRKKTWNLKYLLPHPTFIIHLDILTESIFIILSNFSAIQLLGLYNTSSSNSISSTLVIPQRESSIKTTTARMNSKEVYHSFLARILKINYPFPWLYFDLF